MSNPNPRKVVVALEATGVDPLDGHRIVELALVEMIDDAFTYRSYRTLVNPARPIENTAQAVHGISNELVADAPMFQEIASEIADFLLGSELITHCASFVVEFLNVELTSACTAPVEELCSQVTDTLKMAKALRPNGKNDMGTLIHDLNVEPPRRTMYGSELDAHLTGLIYLELKKRTLH